ncbi:hypothetical protein ANTPLA_LOCUS155 [Anthophora plagiata]
MIQVKNAEEGYEKLREEKAIELEDRRRAMESKSATKRHLRELHIERKEALEREEIQRAQKVAELKIRDLERTHKLAKELARRKRKGNKIIFAAKLSNLRNLAFTIHRY